MTACPSVAIKFSRTRMMSKRPITPSQIMIRRSQLDVMRTNCYQPGPISMPDLGEFSMVPNGKEYEEHRPEQSVLVS